MAELPRRGDEDGAVRDVVSVEGGVLVTKFVAVEDEDKAAEAAVNRPVEDHSGEHTGTEGPRVEPGRREPVDLEGTEAPGVREIDTVVRPGDYSASDAVADGKVEAADLHDQSRDEDAPEPAKGDDEDGK